MRSLGGWSAFLVTNDGQQELETISGSVEQVNSKGTGIKVLGERLNVSQFHPIIPMPTAGELVEARFPRFGGRVAAGQRRSGRELSFRTRMG